MENKLNICCVILAGGKAARMGRDKAMESIGGAPMLHRVVRLANATCARTVVVGRTAPAGWPGELRAEFMDDAEPKYGGPMIAIRSTLLGVGGDILVLACDMPLLSAGVLRALHSAHCGRQPAPWATMAATRDAERGILVEPLLAIYTPRILPAFEEWIRADRRSLQQCRDLNEVHLWLVPEALAPQLVNVNDPHSLALVRQTLDTSENKRT